MEREIEGWQDHGMEGMEGRRGKGRDGGMDRGMDESHLEGNIVRREARCKDVNGLDCELSSLVMKILRREMVVE